MKTQVYQYQNQPITFSLDGEVLVNATTMGKAFGKQPSSFLRNAQTEAFITALQNRIPETEVIQIINGGNNFGTWMHQKLALKFAAWLSPEFELWVYDRIEELLTTGRTEVKPLNPAEMKLQVFKMLEQEAESLKEQLLLTQQVVKQQAPMVAYYNDVLQSENGHAATSMAQDFNMSARAMNSLLKKWGVQRKVGDEWHLCSKYLGHGYTFHKKVPRPNSLGVIVTHLQLMWTEKGRAFLHDLFEKNGYKSKAA